ncbi:kinase-like domain-containing protein [Gigaspora rosea]|uniref:Kinase-like domain-containing protein n=1 Tax=Gigaspora rosea TaxID=44941 RepID=A0A397UR25_9GLOM|nr:kinase-like domain-containing protein [Gigaspora rosea]
MYDYLTPQANPLIDWLKRAISEGHINYFDYEKFTEISLINNGGFGTVNKARWNECKLTVALKSIKNDIKINDKIINDFIKELKTLQKVSFHPNIIQLYGVTRGYPKTGYNLILQYASEGDLRSYLSNNFANLRWVDKLRIAGEITLGLMFLHNHSIIHRDLHSKNILVHENKMMISDFNLSKQLTDISSVSKSSVNGIPTYIDPQCFKDSQYSRNKKSDIYSLGVILWEISSGKPPFESKTAYQSIIQINEGIRETPVEGTPSQYVDLYKLCWAEDPNKRPDAEHVLETLNRIKNPRINSDLITLEDSREIISHIDPLLKDIDIFLIPDKLRLVQRASDDGFGKKIFFKNTKNIERTILILQIKDTHEIIGGYNPLAWRELKGFGSVDSCYETCNSFIFSLKRGFGLGDTRPDPGNLENSIFSKVKCPKRAIYREKGLGPAFSIDLFMVDKKGGKTWGCFKSDYERPIRQSDEYFQIEDYEVFQYL